MSDNEQILKILEKLRDAWREQIKEDTKEDVELAETISLSYDDINVSPPPEKEDSAPPETVIISRESMPSPSSPEQKAADEEERAPETVILPLAGKKGVSKPDRNERQADFDDVSTETVILSPDAVRSYAKQSSEQKAGGPAEGARPEAAGKEVQREDAESRAKKPDDDDAIEKTIILKIDKSKEKDGQR